MQYNSEISSRLVCFNFIYNYSLDLLTFEMCLCSWCPSVDVLTNTGPADVVNTFWRGILVTSPLVNEISSLWLFTHSCPCARGLHYIASLYDV